MRFSSIKFVVAITIIAFMTGCGNSAQDHYEDGIELYKKKDYVEAFKLFKESCANKSSDGCKKLGDMYQKGEGVRQDRLLADMAYADAVKLDSDLCMNGDANKCQEVGKSYLQGGYLVRKDYKKADEHFQKAMKLYEEECNANKVESCFEVGVLYYNAFGVDQSILKAQEYFGLACDGGMSKGCSEYAIMKRNGPGKLESFRINCENDDMSSCYEAGKVYSGNYRGVRQSYEKAIKYHTKACNKGYLDSCIEIGNFYNFGQGVEKDTDKAEQYYSLACDKGNGYACLLQADSIKDHEEKSKEIYKKACDLGNSSGCKKYHELNTAYAHKALDNGDPSIVIEQCDKGDAKECHVLGRAYIVNKFLKTDYAKASYYYERSCELGHAEACNAIGEMYHNGIGVRQDLKKAQRLYTQACKGGYKAGCDNSYAMRNPWFKKHLNR